MLGHEGAFVAVQFAGKAGVFCSDHGLEDCLDGVPRSVRVAGRARWPVCPFLGEVREVSCR